MISLLLINWRRLHGNSTSPGALRRNFIKVAPLVKDTRFMELIGQYMYDRKVCSGHIRRFAITDVIFQSTLSLFPCHAKNTPFQLEQCTQRCFFDNAMVCKFFRTIGEDGSFKRQDHSSWFMFVIICNSVYYSSN